LCQASSPTVPETSILSFTIAMKTFHHRDTETQRKAKGGLPP
jgi:hypothetical protein